MPVGFMWFVKFCSVKAVSGRSAATVQLRSVIQITHAKGANASIGLRLLTLAFRL